MQILCIEMSLNRQIFKNLFVFHLVINFSELTVLIVIQNMIASIIKLRYQSSPTYFSTKQSK